jgi:hypothetical protein
MIAGTQIQDGEKGRCILFDKGLTEREFSDFLDAMMQDSTEFSLFDPKYPSPSDPGAYLSYSPKKDEWLMTLGNHGWSGGVYNITPEIVSRQLYDLYLTGLLEPLGLDRVCFFKHYEPVSAERNEQMNRLLEKIHA